jgi:hypothetical protein
MLNTGYKGSKEINIYQNYQFSCKELTYMYFQLGG